MAVNERMVKVVTIMLVSSGVTIVATVLLGSDLPIMKNEPLAAWMQAAGSFIALGLAIFLPAQQRAAERREREIERHSHAVSIALLIHPTLVLLKEDFLRAMAANRWEDTEIAAPSVLTENVLRYGLLGDTGKLIDRLLGLLSVHNTFLARMFRHEDASKIPNETEALKFAKDRLELMLTICDGSIEAIDHLFKRDEFD